MWLSVAAPLKHAQVPRLRCSGHTSAASPARSAASPASATTFGFEPLDLLDSLVAGTRDPIAVTANRAEFQALISPLGYRPATRTKPEDLRRLSVPTLMIWGDRDPVAPIEAARAAARLIPNARLEVLSAGHVPQLATPNR